MRVKKLCMHERVKLWFRLPAAFVCLQNTRYSGQIVYHVHATESDIKNLDPCTRTDANTEMFKVARLFKALQRIIQV